MKMPTLEVTEDLTDKINDAVKKFKGDAVLVGIPVSDGNRDDTDEEKGPINNASILAINEFGSPKNNIPPRPVMSIGIRDAQDEIAEQFKKAAQAAFSSGFAALNQFYERAGIIASNSIKKVINNQAGIKEPSEGTLAARRAAGFKGTKALIVTGQMRNAITYVVKGK